ncbi:MAG: DUF4920 domain-containing protein [Deltaproteobacteria bacterium]|nr:MAG: DUF4920 domain-containing protein [Deltaproteobacteria bacterium]
MSFRVLALTFSSLLVLGCQSKPDAADPAAAAPAVKVAGAEASPAADEAKPDEAKADEAKPDEAKADEAKPDETVAATETAKTDEPEAGHIGCGKPGCDGEKKPHVEAGCEDVAADQLVKPDEEKVTRPDGTEALHVGHAFAGVEKVAVSALLADPAAFKGKTIALEGDVSAMCGHKRGWFAVAAEDKSGRQVRILTAPTFLVPAGSIGRSAVAEGTVEVVEIAAEHAKHLADEHQLEDPAKIKTENVQRIVVRANGAEFF